MISLLAYIENFCDGSTINTNLIPEMYLQINIVKFTVLLK